MFECDQFVQPGRIYALLALAVGVNVTLFLYHLIGLHQWPGALNIVHRKQPFAPFTLYSRVLNAVKYLLKNFTSPILCNILCKRLHVFLFVRVSAYSIVAAFYRFCIYKKFRFYRG